MSLSNIVNLVNAHAYCKLCAKTKTLVDKEVWYSKAVENAKNAYHNITTDNKTLILDALGGCEKCYVQDSNDSFLAKTLAKLLEDTGASLTEENYHPQQDPGIDY